MPFRAHRARLEDLYGRYTRRDYLAPDPVAFLHAYDDVRDREIVGLVASSLAYGRAVQISKSVAAVLDRMEEPARFLASATQRTLRQAFAGFKHRFTTGEELADVLLGAKRAIDQFGSLHACFAAGLSPTHATVTDAAAAFVDRILAGAAASSSYLLPSPRRGSACKRLNLFLRWMARSDEIDLGGWDDVPRSKLIVPLDTHMHRIALAFGATRRKQANLRAALELTAAFRKIAPHDPVRYDFALTRLGIRSDASIAGLLSECGLHAHGHDA